MKELEKDDKVLLQNTRKVTDVLLGISCLGFVGPLTLAPFLDEYSNRVGTYILLGSCFTSFGLIYLNQEIDKYLKNE